MALVAAILLVWFCLVRRNNQRERSSRDFFNYNVRSPQLGNSKLPAGLPTLARTPADHQHAPLSTQPSQTNLSESAPTLAPIRRDSSGRQYRVVNDTVSTASNPSTSRGLPPLPASSTAMEQKQSLLTLQSSPNPAAAHDGPPPNIQLLASQVAAVMMQNSLDAGGGRPRSMDDGVSAPPSYVVHH